MLKSAEHRWMNIHSFTKPVIKVCSPPTPGFPRGSHDKESASNAGDLGSILGWEDSLEKSIVTPEVFLSGESHRQWSLAGYSPWSHKDLDMIDFHVTQQPLCRSRDSKMHKMIPALQQLCSLVFWNKRIYSLNISFLICKTDSIQFSCLAMSDTLQPHGLQHARLPCPSPTPGAYSNSCL